MADIDYIAAFTQLPYNLLREEIAGIYGSDLLTELGEIIGLYEIYEKGAAFTTEGSKGDYTPANLRFKQAAGVIDKEARFLFSKHPDLWVEVPYNKSDEVQKEAAKSATTVYQNLVDKVVEKNRFFAKLLKAAKDCFIGKRVAYFVNFSEDTPKITISFIPAMEFIYDTDPEDTDVITKIVTFYTVKDSKTRADQRVYKKKYWMKNGVCWIYEAIYDGTGTMVEELIPERPTKFDYIPAGVIVNDGLTGDLQGESEIKKLEGFEGWFSRLSNADIDAERQGMNPVRWVRDMSPDSTKNLSIAAGAFWDLASDQNSANEGTGEVGVLETSMSYSSAITSTLDRIKNSMFEQVDMPNVSPESLKGVVSSGKTLKAIYWGLIVRCEEKMLAWRPALENIVKIILDGAHLYPGSITPYISDKLPQMPYEVRVDNQYPLPEDEAEEKNVDLAEVTAQTMSKKAYMIKWRGLTEEEAQQELEQIAMEQELLNNSAGNMMPPEEGAEDEEDFGDFGEEEELPEEGLDSEEEALLKELDDLEAGL